jgi:HEAT repeat protein
MCGCIGVSGAGTLVSQDEIHRMVRSEDARERREAVEQLVDNFVILPDKEQSWSDLIMLTQDKVMGVRLRALYNLASIFPYISNKEIVLAYLHRLSLNKYADARRSAVNALCLAFPTFLNKQEAWEDLHKLTYDKNNRVKSGAAYALRAAFNDSFCKKQAWEDLHRLTYDKNSLVRGDAADTLGAAFPKMPYKKLAWQDLHRLTQDKETSVRWYAIYALGAVFSNIPYKRLALQHLRRLAQDKEIDIRASAHYSLGRACIFKATEVEDEMDFRNELERALEFFEKSSKEAHYFENPAQFCFPLYRSFHAITFKRHEAETEVQKYLAEAKNAVEDSDSKEKLTEAVENLANALKEVQKTREIDLRTMRCDLNAYRRYCERAADLLDTTEDKAPSATKLIRRGLPIIDQKIKKIITEIQDKSNALCKQTLSTPFEDLGKEVNRIGKNLLKIRDPIGLDKGMYNMQIALSAICAKMPEEERGEACELLKKANDEPYIEDQIDLINMILSKISSQISAAKNIETVEKKLDSIIVSVKPGIREELVITVGAEFAGTGAKHEIHIPLQEITYPEIKNDLEKIKGKPIFKLASLPAKLAEKIKAYLLRTKKNELLKHLT